MDIKFKNGSCIKTVESNDNAIRSKRLEDQLSNQFRHAESNYIEFVEKYLGVNLLWYQKTYLKLLEKLNDDKQ